MNCGELVPLLPWPKWLLFPSHLSQPIVLRRGGASARARAGAARAALSPAVREPVARLAVAARLRVMRAVLARDRARAGGVLAVLGEADLGPARRRRVATPALPRLEVAVQRVARARVRHGGVARRQRQRHGERDGAAGPRRRLRRGPASRVGGKLAIASSAQPRPPFSINWIPGFSAGIRQKRRNQFLGNDGRVFAVQAQCGGDVGNVKIFF